jgi:hypothetical protein
MNFATITIDRLLQAVFSFLTRFVNIPACTVTLEDFDTSRQYSAQLMRTPITDLHDLLVATSLPPRARSIEKLKSKVG